MEDASISLGAPEDRRLAAVVDIREDLGSDVYVHFGVGGPPVLGEDVRAAVGDDAVETTQGQTRRAGNLWVARGGPTRRAQERESVAIVVHTSRPPLFHPRA